MKKQLLAAAFVTCLAATTAGAQIFVRIGPPPRHHEVIPPPVHRGWVWQPGYNRWDGAHYIWVPGRYAEPPYARARWVPGHWSNGPRGHYWVEGHWRR